MLKTREVEFIRRYLSTSPVTLWADPYFTADENDIKRGLLRIGAISAQMGTTSFTWNARVVDLYDEWLQKKGFKVGA